MTAKYLVLDTWAGRRHYPVEVINETPKEVRVRILAQDGVMLPSRRYLSFGEIALVPKRAIVTTAPQAANDNEPPK